MKTGLAAAACVGLLAVTAAAQANIVTFAFSGELNGGPGTHGPAHYSGQYSFESVQPNTSPIANQGEYVLKSMVFDVGRKHLESSEGSIVVLKDQRLQEDAYLVEGLFGAGSVDLTFIYDSLNVFPDVSLPLTPPPLTDFDTLFPSHISISGLFGLDFPETGTVTSFTTTAVSEPATWSLMGVASAAFLMFWAIVPRTRGGRRRPAP